MRRTAAAILITTTTLAFAPAAAASGGHDADSRAGHRHQLPAVYTLPGDPPPEGSKFEGIGYDNRTGNFYVGERTGGEISRGNVREPIARPWLSGDGTDGRWAALGITVDRYGRVYISGGDNSTLHPNAPDMWIYSRSGRLLAALKAPVTGVVINDVAIGPDGAAYFTDSLTPRLFKVKHTRHGWKVTTWDASGSIAQQTGFNLNGIVATPDGRALLAIQSNTGLLWRFDLRTKAVTQVSVPGANLTSGDGLVLRGRTLWVVRNFPRILTTVSLARDWRSGTLVSERATDPDRVFTTAKLAGHRLLLVDSKFDETVGTPPYQVVAVAVG